MLHPSEQSWVPAHAGVAKSAPASALRTVCLFFKLSPLTLGECRITPWEAVGSGVPAVSVGLASVPRHPSPTLRVWSPSCPAGLSWLLCMYLVLGCHPELLGTGVQRSLSDVQHLWGENMYTAPCKALRVYFISCFPFYLLFQAFLWTRILPLNLPEINMSPLFLNLIIDSLLQQELVSAGRGSGCPEEDAMHHQQHSIHQECCGNEAKQPMLSSSRVVWPGPCFVPGTPRSYQW